MLSGRGRHEALLADWRIGLITASCLVTLDVQNRCHISVHCINGAPAHQSTPQYATMPQSSTSTRQCSRKHAKGGVVNFECGNPRQRLRGAVVVPCTCDRGRDILAGVAMRRHREARSSHLSSPDTMLLSAHKSGQCGRRKGGDSCQGCCQPYPGRTCNSHGRSSNFRHLAAPPKPLPLLLPMTFRG